MIRIDALWLGERVRRSIQPHQIAALLGVLHAQREGSPFIGQGFVHDLQEHELVPAVFGHDFGCSGIAVFLRVIFQPLRQDAFGQALPQFINLALQAMRPRFAVFAGNAAVCLIETGDCPRPLLKQAVPQNRHVYRARLACAKGFKPGAPFGLKGFSFGVGFLQVGGLQRCTNGPSAGEVGTQVFRGTEAELVDA